MDLSISKRDYKITYTVVEGSSSHRLFIPNLLYIVNPLYKQSLCKQCRNTEYPIATACLAGYDYTQYVLRSPEA